MATKRNPHTLSPRQWYGTYAWRQIAQQQLRLEPLCRVCAGMGGHEPAWACDHVNGFTDFDSFMCGPFQSLCRRCSDRKQQGHSMSWVDVDRYTHDASNLPPPRRFMPEC
jgi:5-methylcytosine-specific restriction enzyme A